MKQECGFEPLGPYPAYLDAASQEQPATGQLPGWATDRFATRRAFPSSRSQRLR